MWRCAGLRWRESGPVWTWWHPVRGGRSSPLRLGGPLSFAVGEGAVRACAGIRRGRRWSPCPYRAALPPQVRRDQCERCGALDRSSSVASDTRLDDPRPYAVYLAYFGPGRHKVGITAVERGTARLLEQAAVCFTFLGEGPLMTARRTEAVLGAALHIPDRVPDPAKRAARLALPPAATRAAELRARYDEVAEQRGRLPDSLRLRPFAVVDHAARFGLDPAPPEPGAAVTALPPGCVLTGTVLACAGHDLYLGTPSGPLLLDTRLTAGWPLVRAETGGPAGAPAVRVPTAAVARPVEQPEPLF